MADNRTATEYAKHRAQRDSRVRVREDIRATRQRLANGNNTTPDCEYELLAMFVRNEQSAAATMWALAAIFALASMFWAPKFQGALWLVMAIAAKVFLLELCRRFNAVPKAELDVEVWRRRFVLTELLNGVIWASFALVGVGGDMTAQGQLFSSHVFLFATLIVLLSIRLTFASPVMPILYAGTIPMTVAVVGRLLMLDNSFYYALASMAVGVLVYFIFLAKGLNQTAVNMLEYRAQKDALIAELEESRLVSDEARRRAETASKAKSRFLATMSHELRTPLNAIMGFSEVMKGEVMGPMGNPMYREYATNIYESGRHLLHLINEILDLSRIEAGRFELHEETVQLVDVAEDCHRLLKLKAESKGLELVEDYDADLPQLRADNRALRQVCINLISNALKFTPKGGRITIRVATTPDGGQVLSVIDTGPGIPADEIPKVLQAFGQGSLAHESAEGGTGLGLPIVQNLIELHGGTFELKSELRKGTQAIARLPKERVLGTSAPLNTPGKAPPMPSKAAPRSRRPSRLITAAAVVQPQTAPAATAADPQASQ